jgi:hypothetical protein
MSQSFSSGIVVPQLVALESLVIEFHGWSHEHGPWSVARQQHSILELLAAGVFFASSSAAFQFLAMAYEYEVYSWGIDRFSPGTYSVRLVQSS